MEKNDDFYEFWFLKKRQKQILGKGEWGNIEQVLVHQFYKGQTEMASHGWAKIPLLMGVVSQIDRGEWGTPGRNPNNFVQINVQMSSHTLSDLSELPKGSKIYSNIFHSAVGSLLG